MSFLDKAKDFAAKHDKQVDKLLEKVGDEVDKRTGHKHSQHIDRAVDEAQRRTGQGDTRPAQSDPSPAQGEARPMQGDPRPGQGDPLR